VTGARRRYGRLSSRTQRDTFTRSLTSTLASAENAAKLGNTALKTSSLTTFRSMVLAQSGTALAPSDAHVLVVLSQTL
jgi:hypothetical protein